MKRVRVVVTQEDIDKGERGSSQGCALARALRRIHPAAIVGTSVWTTNGWSGATEYPLGWAAERFAEDFDRGDPVEPATFVLPGPGGAS
jgi:hypothetical protein